MENSKTGIDKSSQAVNFAAILLIIGGLMYAAPIVTSFLLALFISIICAQPIYWLHKRKVPQPLAVGIVIVLVGALFLGFGEIIASSFSTFSQDAPLYEQNLNEMGNTAIQYLNSHGMNVSFDELSKTFQPSKIMGITAGFLGQLGGLMGNTFTIGFLTLFLLLEVDSFPIKIKAITKSSKDSLSYIHIIVHSIRHYLFIKTVTSLLTGVLIWICLTIIGVDYAIIWALIAFLLNYIPNIGSIIAALPAVIFSLVQLGLGGVIWTSVVFVAANMIVGNMVEPKMMGKGLGLSTFVVFLSLIVWGFVFGTVGMFLSVPITMTIKIILEQNANTKWLAIILGTQQDAEAIVEANESS